MIGLLGHLVFEISWGAIWFNTMGGEVGLFIGTYFACKVDYETKPLPIQLFYRDIFLFFCISTNGRLESGLMHFSI